MVRIYHSTISSEISPGGEIVIKKVRVSGTLRSSVTEVSPSVAQSLVALPKGVRNVGDTATDTATSLGHPLNHQQDLAIGL